MGHRELDHHRPTGERTAWLMLVVPALLVVALALFLAWILSQLRDTAAGDAEQAGALRVFTNSIGMQFVALPGGTFWMGSPEGVGLPEERPRRQVRVAPFYMGRHEVTQAQWERVMGYNPSAHRGPRRPVEQVTWHEVQAFLRALNRLEGTTKYRLPSEAEWEYAARAGTETRWFFGDDPSLLHRYAWFGQRGDVGPRAVGRGAPNPWGLYDVYGNVWEWVQDCWHGNYEGAPADGRVWAGGDCSLRMLRGGGWNSPAEYARSAVRGSYAPELNDMANGFRVARSP